MKERSRRFFLWGFPAKKEKKNHRKQQQDKRRGRVFLGCCFYFLVFVLSVESVTSDTFCLPAMHILSLLQQLCLTDFFLFFLSLLRWIPPTHPIFHCEFMARLCLLWPSPWGSWQRRASGLNKPLKILHPSQCLFKVDKLAPNRRKKPFRNRFPPLW